MALRLAAAGAILWASNAAEAALVAVEMQDMGFSPGDVSAHVGDTVLWTNDDFVDHTSTARDGQWDVVVPAGGKKRLKLKRAGTIDYYCRFHPQMTGRISVAPP